MSDYSLKTIRKQFSDNGVFYTDEAAAMALKEYMPADLTEVYDPTCGAGNLLAVFGDEVAKYGQELNAEQAAVAADRLANAHIVAGNTLTEPAFMDKRFRGIVANYPFSVKWEPDAEDVRFKVAPCTAPPSRADWAFLLHILYLLADDGVAATLCSPGIGYRGNKEGEIRRWFVDQGYIHECQLIESGHFADTSIQTLLLVMRKAPADRILFKDCETDKEITVSIDEVRDNGYILSPHKYLPVEIEDKWKDYDPVKAERDRRGQFLNIVDAEIKFAKLSESMCGLAAEPFIDAIIAKANMHRQNPSLFI